MYIVMFSTFLSHKELLWNNPYYYCQVMRVFVTTTLPKLEQIEEIFLTP